MVFGPGNCTNAPQQTSSDAGVAGAGVSPQPPTTTPTTATTTATKAPQPPPVSLMPRAQVILSFIITAGLAFVLASYIIVTELQRASESRIARKLLLSLSDQQIVTGIGIQSVGLAKLATIVPYHFFLIWMLSSISTATHSASLLALFNDFKRDWVLRWLRQGLMFVNLLLSIVYGILVLENIVKRLSPTLAMGCLWHDAQQQQGPRSDGALSIAGTVAVLAGNALVFAMAVWYLHSGTPRWLKVARAISLIFLFAIGVGAAVRVVMLSQAFGRPSVPLADRGEKDWSFGQLLPLLLLLLPLMSAVEIARGEMKVPPPLPDDQVPLYAKAHSEHGIEFQPNPFFNTGARREN